MTKPEFWAVFSDHPGLYIWIVAVILFLSFCLTRVLRISLFHPATFYLFFNYQFALIAVVYLSFLGYIEAYLYGYFYFSQLFFWIGFIFFYIVSAFLSRARVKGEGGFKLSRGFRIAYNYSFYSYLFVSIFSFGMFGVPALADSKWSVYAAIPLAGVIGRVISALPYFIVVCLSVSYLNFGRLKRFDFFVLFVLILFGALGGSKVFFLKLFFIAFLVFFNLDRPLLPARNLASGRVSKKGSILFLGAIACFLLVSILVYYHQLATRSVSENPFMLIVQRLVMSGDLQIMTLPNSVIERLNYGESLVSIVFYELKGLLAVLGVLIEGRSLGVKTMVEHYPSWEANIGPASTFDVFFYVYFKQIAYLTCFVVGALVGFLSAFKVRARNESELILYVILVCGVYVLIYNPQIWISETIFNLTFFMLFYLLVKLRVALNGK
ncbi:hypothetical protein [Stutzerimonas nitrititolerans]|uniref:hypothetical protein n=1 Tax=Stutzerimonas nitrititolerans TaxID=2482751 RepID=UPI0028ABA38E|nr:hypothetical protein [Stutzerimonas nitrititolerans]